MQITIWEIADCWTEEEILSFRKRLNDEINLLNLALDLKIQRLLKMKINKND